jgi:hypothetical protein
VSLVESLTRCRGICELILSTTLLASCASSKSDDATIVTT